MSAKKMLNPDQFTFEYKDWGNDQEIRAYHPEFGGGKVHVGSIAWQKEYGKKWGRTLKPGEIGDLGVVPEYRRQGLGTRLYNEAMKYDPKPVHSAVQTKLGKQWSSAVGGESV